MAPKVGAMEAGMEAEAARRVAAAAEPLPADDEAGQLVELNDAIAVHVVAGALEAPDPSLVRAAVVVDKDRTADVIVGRVGDTQAADRGLARRRHSRPVA